MNAKRLYVHRSRMDELVSGLSARLEKVVLGHGLGEGTTMGPLHQPAQKAFVSEIIEEAKASGATVREFGELPGGEFAEGNFLRPAIVVDPDPSLRVVIQEQFGPVIPVIPFDDDAEAVRRPTTRGQACAPRSGPRTPTPPTGSVGSWSAATSGSTTTAPRGWTCGLRSAA